MSDDIFNQFTLEEVAYYRGIVETLQKALKVFPYEVQQRVEEMDVSTLHPDFHEWFEDQYGFSPESETGQAIPVDRIWNDLQQTNLAPAQPRNMTLDGIRDAMNEKTEDDNFFTKYGKPRTKDNESQLIYASQAKGWITNNGELTLENYLQEIMAGRQHLEEEKRRAQEALSASDEASIRAGTPNIALWSLEPTPERTINQDYLCKYRIAPEEECQVKDEIPTAPSFIIPESKPPRGRQ